MNKKAKDFGNYVLEQSIGEGSYGQVYRARHKGSGEACAVKVIVKKGKHQKELACLRGEIDIMKRLRHQNIIQLRESYETPSEVVIVTELAERDLSAELDARGGFPESEIRSIAGQIVSALLYLNDNRIVHRDLKPQNILVQGGVVKLCDFGFARKMSVQTVVLKSLKGTPLYIAPEIFKEQPYNFKIDIWSLGIILYELYTGLPPFYSDNYYSLFNKILNEGVQFPESMSPALRELIEGTIRKAPEERYDWAQILSSPFLAGPSLPDLPPLNFSIQLEAHSKLRASLLPTAPPSLSLQELKDFDRDSREHPEKLRASLLFYHKVVTLFTLAGQQGVPPQWSMMALSVLARVAKKAPEKELDYDIFTKQDLLELVADLMSCPEEELVASATGVVGLILKAQGQSLCLQQVESVVEQLRTMIPKAALSFANAIKLCGILSQSRQAGQVVPLVGLLLQRLSPDSPREHFVVLEVVQSMIRASTPVFPAIQENLAVLNAILEKGEEEAGVAVLSIYAHCLRIGGMVEAIRASKPCLTRPKFSALCPHVQYFVCCELGTTPPFEGNCALTHVLSLCEQSKHKIFKADESVKMAGKVFQLISSKSKTGHKDIDFRSEFNDFVLPVLARLDPSALKDAALLDQLLNGHSGKPSLSKQAVGELLPLLEKVNPQCFKAGFVNELSQFAKEYNAIPAVVVKHLSVDAKSKAGVQVLLEIGWAKHCLESEGYLSKKNGAACLCLLHKLLLKEESLAGLLLDHFQRLRGFGGVDLVSISSHIARLKMAFYPRLKELDVLGLLKGKIDSEEDLLVEKSLNLIGNLCKHSTYFFDEVEAFLPRVLNSLTSTTKRRRQAVFVLGNLFFYSDRYSDLLQPKYQAVVAGLDSSDDMIIENTLGLLVNIYKYERWAPLVVKSASKVMGLLCEKQDRNRIIVAFLLKVAGDKSLQKSFPAESFERLAGAAKQLNMEEKQIAKLRKLAKEP